MRTKGEKEVKCKQSSPLPGKHSLADASQRFLHFPIPADLRSYGNSGSQPTVINNFQDYVHHKEMYTCNTYIYIASVSYTEELG